ncbi:MAG TPA: cyclic nucleotide-binding domain-containing protein, partial [Labilithrix sp.]
MTVATLPTRWPDVVWNTALLRGLDARARAEIEAAGSIRTLRKGDTVHRAGEPADAIGVVIAGRVALAAVRRGEAEASVIRRVAAGETFGEEATVAQFATRQLDARCDEAGSIAEIPLVVLRRALGRAGAEEHTHRLERALRRAATLDLLRTTAFTSALPDRDVEILLDAARHVHVARGEHLFRAGDAADAAYLVADGLLQAQTDDDGKPRVEAYLSRGDLLGDAELEDRDVRGVSVVASGPAWLVAIPRDVFVVVARRNASLLEGARRVRGEAAARLPSGATTAHVFKDLYRMRVARSLLVIDQDSCVRCGHCAWSCASVHDDGISRLVRQGERIVVEKEEAKAPLLVPNSCQHCKNPACMIDCPTGAIG